jgi:hypothetical protein
MNAELSIMIAGGPLAIGVFEVNKQQISHVIKAEIWISGFCFKGSTLYVQDGPVLSAWNLIDFKKFASVTLGTTVTVPQAHMEAGPAAELAVDASLEQLAAADLRSSLDLMQVRHRHAWAAFLDMVDTAVPGLEDTVSKKAGAFSKEARALLATIGNDGTAKPLLLAGAEEALQAATAAAARTFVSAPRVREFSRNASNEARIFSLAGDGTIYSMSLDLKKKTSYMASAFKPLRAEMLLYEANDRQCQMYWVTEKGGIAVFDVADVPPREQLGWKEKGPAPVREKVLPLRFIDGKLSGGGILGADFFMSTPDPAKTSFDVTIAAPTGGWRNYQVADDLKMVLLSNGQASRLVSWDPALKKADRWNLRQAAAPCFSVFMATPGAQKLPMTLELDVQAKQRVLLRLFNGKTIVDDAAGVVTAAVTPAAPHVVQLISSDGSTLLRHGANVMLRCASGKIVGIDQVGTLRLLAAADASSTFILRKQGDPAASNGTLIVHGDKIGLTTADGKHFVSIDHLNDNPGNTNATSCATRETFTVYAAPAVESRALLAQTLDPADPKTALTYPPLPNPLDNGLLLGFGNFMPAALLRCPPLRVNDELWSIVSPVLPATQVAKLFDKDVQSAATQLLQQLRQAVVAGELVAPKWSLLEQDMLIKLSLADTIRNLQAAGQLEQQRLQRWMQPIRLLLRCTVNIFRISPVPTRFKKREFVFSRISPIANLPVVVSIDSATFPVSSFALTTDRDGMVWIDGGTEDCPVRFHVPQGADGVFGGASAGPIRIVRDGSNVLQGTVDIDNDYRWDQ